MGTREIRREITESGGPLARHSINQEIIKKIVEGEKRIGQRQTINASADGHEKPPDSDHPFYFIFKELRQQEQDETIPQRLANFADIVGYTINELLKGESLPNVSQTEYIMRQSHPGQRNLVSGQKILPRVFEEIKKVENVRQLAAFNQRLLPVRTYLDMLLTNVTSIDFSALPEEEVAQKIEAWDLTYVSSIVAVRQVRMSKATVRAVCRGAADSIWDQLWAA